MVKTVTLLLAILLVLAACHGRKKIAQVPIVKEIDTKMLKYTFISSEIQGDSLNVKLQYGGGCVKPHEFKLVRTASTLPGEVNLYLLHTTLTDKCKALVRTELNFAINTLIQDTSINSIKLNGEKEMLPQLEKVMDNKPE
jgi:hypothetical protein